MLKLMYQECQRRRKRKFYDFDIRYFHALGSIVPIFTYMVSITDPNHNFCKLDLFIIIKVFSAVTKWSGLLICEYNNLVGLTQGQESGVEWNPNYYDAEDTVV
jgi:hypothetical protein